MWNVFLPHDRFENKSIVNKSLGIEEIRKVNNAKPLLWKYDIYRISSHIAHKQKNNVSIMTPL